MAVRHLLQISQHPLEGPESFGTVLAYSSDDRLFAASDLGVLHLFDPQSWSPIRALTNTVGRPERILSLAFSTNLVVAGYRRGAVTLNEIATWREIAVTNAHRSFASAVAISPDEQTLATAGSDSLIHLLEMPVLPTDASGPDAQPISLKKKATLKGHLSPINALAFSPDGQVLASASRDGTAKFWRPPANHEEKKFKDAISPLWFSPDSQRLLTANIEEHDPLSTTLCLSHWDLTSGKATDRIPIPLGRNVWFCRAVSPDGQTLALGLMNDGTVELWSLQSRTRFKKFKVCQETVEAITFAPREPQGRARSPPRADTREGTSLAYQRRARSDAPYQVEDPTAHFQLAAAPHDDLLATAGLHERTVNIWNLATPQVVVSLPDATSPLAFSPDGKMLATGGGNKDAIKLWHWATRKTVATLEGHTAFIASVAFSPNGKLLATGSADNTVRLWDVASKRMVGLPLGGHQNGVSHLVFSPEGKTLVSGTWDNEVKFWNLATGQELFTVDEFIGFFVRSPLFSPDGNLLALGAIEGHSEMKLWRAPSLEEIDAKEKAKAEQSSRILRKETK